MPLQLKKPLIFLDIEATGLNITRDRLVEISLLKLQANGQEERKTWRVNPEMPIPPKISKLIHITDEEVAELPVFKKVAHEIHAFMGGADLAG